MVQFPTERERGFNLVSLLLQRVQTGYNIHPVVSYSVDTIYSFPEIILPLAAKVSTHFHLGSRLRMRGTVLLLYSVGFNLKTRKTLP